MISYHNYTGVVRPFVRRAVRGKQVQCMTVSGKIKQKIADGSLREMWDETKWMLTYIFRYRFVIVIHILLGIVGTCMSLLSSIGMKRLIDSVTGFRYSNIWGDALYMAGMLLGSVILSAIAGRIAAVINIRVQNGIQAEIYDRMLRTDWESLEQYRSGDLLQRLNGDVGTVASGVTSFLPSFVTACVQFFGSLAIILFYDPIMALIALIGAPLSVICSRVIVRRMRDYNKRMKVLSSEVMSFHDDTFRNLTTIKGFGIMNGFHQRMLDLQRRYREAFMDYNRFSVIASLVMSLVGLAISAGCFGWGVYRLWSHAISFGVMTMFLQLTGILRGSFSSIIGLVPSYISITTSAGRLMAVVELPEEPGARETLPDLDGDCACTMRDVTFSYADGETVLEHVDMEVRPGELVALTGPSGEGKTTMVRLMLGLVRPVSGDVTVTTAGGEAHPASAATRAAFSYVPQGNTIFAGTIADNLRMVRPDATDEQIMEALEIACAWEFVRKLPHGIESETGELGRGFSEGQAQRLAVARAVLRRAPILLLDEATSALDEDTEQRMLKNLMERGGVRSCVLITHRPNTARICNRHYVLRGTTLAEETAP